MTDTNIPQNSTTEYKRTATTDYILMLCIPFAVSIFTQGLQAIINVVLSIATCLFFTWIGKKFLKITFTPKAPHTYVIGLSVALLLPASSPWWMIVLTAGFAMGVCVLPFGNPDNIPFIPSATAICFATLCWPELIYDYSDLGESLGQMLLFGNSVSRNSIAILEVLTGAVPSALGTGCILALIGTIFFILIRRPKDCLPVFTFIIAVCVMAILFPRVSTGKLMSVIMELCSGMILFGAVFFISSPTFSPVRTLSKVLWGFASGVICMIIRYVTPFEEGACFGFVISCALSSFFDNLPLTRKEKKRIKDLVPYVETESSAPSVVPEEILNEIPDISVEEIIQQVEEPEIIEEIIIPDSDNLDTIISAENTVSETDSPFVMGGGNDE